MSEFQKETLKQNFFSQLLNVTILLFVFMFLQLFFSKICLTYMQTKIPITNGNESNECPMSFLCDKRNCTLEHPRASAEMNKQINHLVKKEVKEQMLRMFRKKLQKEQK